MKSLAIPGPIPFRPYWVGRYLGGYGDGGDTWGCTAILVTVPLRAKVEKAGSNCQRLEHSCVMANHPMELDLDNPNLNPENTVDSASYLDTLEAVISSLDQGDGAMVSKTDEGHLWTFKYGSVHVFVLLTGETETDTLTVWSPVLTLPAKDEPRLMRHLLEMNCNETLEARFGLSGDQILVIASRILQDISAAEISRLMTIVATIADDCDETLQAEFAIAPIG